MRLYAFYPINKIHILDFWREITTLQAVAFSLKMAYPIVENRQTAFENYSYL
ncbi:hypothetical protein [Muribacter muris]|uniref:hypothetical protein n=1 Tax=Muribacter muris TaxID=67855 RepID=UPI001ADDC584|nr:hypothetical protein [Muribacter muris]